MVLLLRQRGAKATDIVARGADDGVMPQRLAISHARAAMFQSSWRSTRSTSNRQPQQDFAELLQHEIGSKGMGGDTLDVEVSAMS
jgi:hypothetical protein